MPFLRSCPSPKLCPLCELRNPFTLHAKKGFCLGQDSISEGKNSLAGGQLHAVSSLPTSCPYVRGTFVVGDFVTARALKIRKVQLTPEGRAQDFQPKADKTHEKLQTSKRPCIWLRTRRSGVRLSPGAPEPEPVRFFGYTFYQMFLSSPPSSH